MRWLISERTFVAIGMVMLAVVLLYRKITSIGWMSKLLLGGVMDTMGWIILPASATSMQPGLSVFRLAHLRCRTIFSWASGSAMLIATYDYWGYYNVSFLGMKSKDPQQDNPAGATAIHSAGGLSICCDEHQHPGGGAVAGDDARGTVESRIVCGLDFHADGFTERGRRTWSPRWSCGRRLRRCSR